jgi:hypothetical protein
MSSQLFGVELHGSLVVSGLLVVQCHRPRVSARSPGAWTVAHRCFAISAVPACSWLSTSASLQ